MIVLVLWAATAAQAQSAADSAAIRQPALDYIEGWYEADAERMERALHPDLAKRIVRTNPRTRRASSWSPTAGSTTCTWRDSTAGG
jgi:hypothetical protein